MFFAKLKTQSHLHWCVFNFPHVFEGNCSDYRLLKRRAVLQLYWAHVGNQCRLKKGQASDWIMSTQTDPLKYSQLSSAQNICTYQLGPDQYISLLILSADIDQLQIYPYQRTCSLTCADDKTVFKAGKNARPSDLKWFIYYYLIGNKWGVYCLFDRYPASITIFVTRI